MAVFEIAYAPVRDFEGSYSNDKNDKGGETYCGISRYYFPKWSGWSIIDTAKKKTSTTKEMLAYLKTTKIESLVDVWYKEEWWDKLGLESLDQDLANEILEQAINLGKSGSVKKIQTICNAYNYKDSKSLFTDLVVDGIIGPKTLAALSKIISSGKAESLSLVHALNCMQGAHYLENAASNPSQRKFTVGWMTRTYDPK